MRAWFKKLFTPKVKAFNPEYSFRVSGVMRWRLCSLISEIPGVVFVRRPWLLGSSAKPISEFRFRDIDFQVDDGGDTGSDGLWITPKDEQPHPIELEEIREHLKRSLMK